MKKVTIFGATGGIGRHAVRHALEKGYEVVAYVRNPGKVKEEHPRLTMVKGELTDADMAQIATLDTGRSTIIDPDNIETARWMSSLVYPELQK